jgi:hypothetical protein
MPSSRRFPTPWSAELQPNHYVVRDHNGQALAYVYYESEPGRRSAAILLMRDVARRIAANVANRICLRGALALLLMSRDLFVWQWRSVFVCQVAFAQGRHLSVCLGLVFQSLLVAWI